MAECLANFLCGEGRLEGFLEQTPPLDVNINKAKSGLAETRKYLLLAANEKDKQVSYYNEETATLAVRKKRMKIA